MLRSQRHAASDGGFSPQTGLTYAWSCVGTCGFTGPTDQPTVAIAPTQSTDYIISVTGPGSVVTVQDTVAVAVDDCSGIALDIPSGFTPDADQVNDVWVIANADLVPSLTVEVFDRNGNSVYRSEDYQNDWDGTYEGNCCRSVRITIWCLSRTGRSTRGPSVFCGSRTFCD